MADDPDDFAVNLLAKPGNARSLGVGGQGDAVGVKFKQSDFGWLVKRDQHLELQGAGFLRKTALAVGKERSQDGLLVFGFAINGNDKGKSAHKGVSVGKMGVVV